MAAVFASLTVLLAVLAAAWAMFRRRPARATLAAGSPDAVSPSSTTVDGTGAAARAGEQPRDDEPVGPPVQGDLLPRLYAVVLGNRPPVRAATVPRGGHAEVVGAAAAILARIENQARYTPRRPSLLPQLMRTINDPDASGRAIAAIIARDPALAGNLLRIANSALYRVQSRPVENIERAVALVGTDGIRQIIAAALVQPVMGAGGGVFGRFPPVIWEHTLLSAAAAADHAKLVERDDGFAAQLLGLMHGLGASIVLRVVRDQYARKPLLIPDARLATALLDEWTTPTARRLAIKWELSERIDRALEEQRHETVPAPSPLGRSLRFGRLAGGLALLCGQGRMDDAGALPVLWPGQAGNAAISGIWERLRRGID